MQWRELERGKHGRTCVLVFQTGDEVMDGLSSWCGEQRVAAARFTAIGGLSDLVLGWFDWQAKTFHEIPVAEQVEVVSMLGDVALGPDGEPAVHAHLVVGRSDGTTRGGHLIRAQVRPTLELVLDEVPVHLHKRHDPQTGLALIAPTEG
jgi:predicted DNA-binding protein with PD1-like motif